MTISSNRVNVTLADAKPMVKALISSGIPTNLLSSPGLGKSDLIKCLKSHGLDDLQTLSSFIHKAKQNEHAIQSAQA